MKNVTFGFSGRIRMVSVFCVILSAIAAASAQPTKQPVDIPKPARSVVKAFVYFEDTGRPVKRTSVLLMPANREGGGGGREASGVTDNGGRGEFTGLTEGKYFAIVNAPGVVSPLAYVDIRSRRGDFGDNEEIAALPAIYVDGVSNAELQIPARRGGAISGRVIYPDGDPAIGVSVAVLRKVGDEFLPSVSNLSSIVSMMTSGGAGSSLTDDRGFFRFAGLPAGEYLVKVTENVEHTKSGSGRGYRDPFTSMLFGNNSMVTAFFKDVTEKDKAELLKLELGQEHPEINIVLPERELRKLSGKVVAAKDKLPIRNAQVSIKREGDDSSDESLAGPYGPGSTKITYSNGKGEWEYVDLPQGKYTITIKADNSEFDDTAKAYGYDRDEMAANVNYAVARASNAIANASNSMSNAGIYGRGPQKPPARKFAAGSKEFEIVDKDLSDQVIELSHGSTFSGTVTVENGTGLPSGANIVLTDEKDDNTVSTHLGGYDYDDDDGQIAKKSGDFVIEAVSTGRKFLTVQLQDDDYYVKSAVVGETDLIQNPIEFKNSEDIRNVKIVLAKDVGTLKGSIVDESSRSIPRFSLSLVPTDKTRLRNSSYYRHVKSNENGEFETKLPPFEYAIVVFPKSMNKAKREELIRWLLENIKGAQTFKVEAGKSQNLTIKQKAEPAKK